MNTFVTSQLRFNSVALHAQLFVREVSYFANFTAGYSIEEPHVVIPMGDLAHQMGIAAVRMSPTCSRVTRPMRLLCGGRSPLCCGPY
jgi:hypothetical protein